MKKFMTSICTGILMTIALTINVSTAIKEENILFEIDKENFVSYEEETYNWAEGWNGEQTTGKVNCIKEGTKVKFSFTSDERIKYSENGFGEKRNNTILNGIIYKLDGNTITHISDSGKIIQSSLSTGTPIEFDFSKSNFYNNIYLSNPNGNYIQENNFNTNFLYVFTVSDWDDEDINQKVMT